MRKDGSVLLEIYHRLLAAYGPQGWWPGESAFEVCIGAILTQNTAWRNVEKALACLKDAGVFSLWDLDRIPEAELAEVIRSSGAYRTKARKLKAFVAHLSVNYGGDLGAFLALPMDDLRDELLGVYGIGEETADDIVLYAARKASFVVDAYTGRIIHCLGLLPERDTYAARRALFMERLPSDVGLFNEYHALLVHLGSEVCLKREPRCLKCPLLGLCPTGRDRVEPARMEKQIARSMR